MAEKVHMLSSDHRKKSQQYFAGNWQNLKQTSSCTTTSSLPALWELQ